MPESEYDEVVYVESTIFIGGSIEESLLEHFVKKIARYLYQDQYQGTKGLKAYLERMEKTIHLKIKTCTTLDFSVTTQNGEISGDFIMYCLSLNMSVKIRTAPYVNRNGLYMNEIITLYLPGHTNPLIIPTDGEANPTTLVESVFIELDQIMDEYEKPLKDAPLSLNDNGPAGEITRRKLAGEPLRKILTEVLKSRIDYPDTAIPDFKLI